MFYMGDVFDKETNKEYKTLDGAKKAAEKAGLSVYDEEGVKVYALKVELTDNVPDGALEENEDGSVNVYNKAGEKIGTATPEEVKAAEEQITPEDIEQAAAAAKARSGRRRTGRSGSSWSDPPGISGKAASAPCAVI